MLYHSNLQEWGQDHRLRKFVIKVFRGKARFRQSMLSCDNSYNSLLMIHLAYYKWHFSYFYIPPHDSGGVLLWFHAERPCVCPPVSRTWTSVFPSVFRFRMITWVNINVFSPNLVCALILWRSDLGLLMANFVQFLRSYLPETCPYFRFRMITWINVNGFSPNLVCALILWRSGLGLLMGKICQILTELSAQDTSIFLFSGR